MDGSDGVGGQEASVLSLTSPARCGTLEALGSSTKASVGVAVSFVSAVGCQFCDGWPCLSLILVAGRVLELMVLSQLRCSGVITASVMLPPSCFSLTGLALAPAPGTCPEEASIGMEPPLQTFAKSHWRSG